MRLSKLCVAVWFIGVAISLTSCRTGSASRQASPPPAEITQQHYLYEIVRYLYRWQLDDAEIKEIYKKGNIIFWAEQLGPRLDAGDKSVLAKIFLPQLNMSVTLKNADYRVEELNTTVKSQSFRVTEVSRGDVPSRRPANAIEVEMPLQEIRDYLFNSRNTLDYPDAALIEHLRAAARAEMIREFNKSTNAPATDQTIYVSAMSPVANDLWVYWEDRGLLFYFASDIDLSEPVVWEHTPLVIRVFDINQQVVVTHEEAPGSNRFLTRNEVGRALYNCIVLGKKMALAPLGPPPAVAGSTPP